MFTDGLFGCLIVTVLIQYVHAQRNLVVNDGLGTVFGFSTGAFSVGYDTYSTTMVLIRYVHAQGNLVVNDGLGTVILHLLRSPEFPLEYDTYSTTMEVKINCRSVPGRGLVCTADYPDHCKEQWNFPNPCTQINIDMNITKFVHPFDKSKFLMCGQMGKLYVVQCPQYEVFHEGCSQCVGAEAGLTASCEVPLPPSHRNVCTREAILNNKLFFPFPGNLSRFIHCDIWGKPWERICTPGEVWSKWDVTCVLPHLLNPCNRPTTDLNYLYSHPCDPAIYLTCDSQGRAHEVNCLRGEAFHEENQRCQPYADFPDRVLTSFCENYMFGFRQNNGNSGFLVDQTGTSQILGGTVSGIKDNRGVTIDRTTGNIGGSISVVPNPSGQGSSTTFDLRGGQLNRETNLQGQGSGTASFDRTTQVRGGSLAGQVNTDGQGNFGGLLDIKRGSISGSSSGTIGQGGSGTNFIDIRGKSLSTNPGTAEFVDIRNAGTSGTRANMIDIRGEKGIGARNMVDIRNIGSGSSGAGIVDIQGVGTGGIAGEMGGTIATDQSTGIVGGMTTDISGGMLDIAGTGTGAGGAGMIDIRGVGTGGTVGGIGITNSGTGTSGAGMVDIRGGKISGTKNMVNIRGVGTGGITGDISGSGINLSGGMADITGTRTGTSGGGMVDIRGGKLSGTRNMVDIRTGGTGAQLVDILGTGTDLSGGVIDTSGVGTGTSGAGMLDIRGGQASGTKKMVDIRGSRTGTGGIVDISGSGTQVSGNTVSGSLTGGSGFVDTLRGRNVGGMVDIRGSQTGATGINSGSISGLGGVSSFDIRNQLGLNGQSSLNNIDRTGTIKTDTISIKGTSQGGTRGSGTMQDLLNTWNQIIETGSTSTGRATNTQMGSNQVGKKVVGESLFTVHPSRLKLYDYSDIPFSEPCTQVNLDAGRTHFRFRGHPHMFLQCDTSGRMHRMPCSSVGQDYFDPYTNTCVDGPVHVDNRIQ